MTHIRLNGPVDLRIDASFERAEGIWQAALSANQVFHVRTHEGELVAVNPNQILYIERSEDESAAA